MPKINKGQIEYNTYVDKPKKYLIVQQIGEDTEDLITKLITNYKETLSGIDDVIVKYLDEESCVINDKPLLNILAKKIQKDIKKTSEVIDDFKTQFVNQVTDHKAQEANETYRKTMEEYDKRKQGFTNQKNLYNKTRKQDEDIDGSYKTILPEAYFNPGSDIAAPKLSFGVGNKYDSAEQKVLQTSFDTNVLDFYNEYVTVAVDLKNEYGSNGGHNEIKSKFEEFTEISKAITNPNTSSSSKNDTNTSKTKTDIDGFIKDTPVYFKNGKCYTKNEKGEEQLVYYYQNQKKIPVTEEMFKNPKMIPANVYYQKNNGALRDTNTDNIKNISKVIDGSEFKPSYKVKNISGDPTYKDSEKELLEYNDNYYYEGDNGEMIPQNRYKDKTSGGYTRNLNKNSSQYKQPDLEEAIIKLKNGDGIWNDTYKIVEKISGNNEPNNNTYIQTEDGKIYNTSKYENQ